MRFRRNWRFSRLCPFLPMILPASELETIRLILLFPASERTSASRPRKSSIIASFVRASSSISCVTGMTTRSGFSVFSSAGASSVQQQGSSPQQQEQASSASSASSADSTASAGGSKEQTPSLQQQQEVSSAFSSTVFSSGTAFTTGFSSFSFSIVLLSRNLYVTLLLQYWFCRTGIRCPFRQFSD